MLREKRKSIIERSYRINFIKTELLRLVGKSFIKNTKITADLRVLATTTFTNNLQKKKKSMSIFKFYCMYNLSPKLVNKKYLLSRFSFNKIAHAGKIPGIIKKGW